MGVSASLRFGPGRHVCPTLVPALPLGEGRHSETGLLCGSTHFLPPDLGVDICLSELWFFHLQNGGADAYLLGSL